MAKKQLRKFFPNMHQVRDHKHLRVFGKLIHNPNLWQLNRYSVATAFSIGLFIAFIPIPFQMVVAAAVAIIFKANLPISVILVWFTNPITMPPMFYFAFKVGAFVLNTPAQRFNFEPSVEWLTSGMLNNWQPFLLGCFICGSTLAVVSNVLIRLLWRYYVLKDWYARKLKRKLKMMKKTDKD